VTAGPPARVGFVGLGSMGAGMARRLLESGYPLVVWNLTESRSLPLLSEGR
jgi:3-hydroxyisobutyrate dehydrogenase-like beta-hydroxyacid dehydrogenase